MTEGKIILKLKDPITYPDGEPVKQPEKVKEHFKTEKGQKIQKTGQEIMAEAPVLNVGELLYGILINGIKPESATEAGKLNILAKKVANKLATGKGEWEVDTATIDELLKLVSKVEMSQGVQLTLGAIVAILEQSKATIVYEEAKKGQELK